MHVVSVVGARPQFIKASAVSRKMRERGIRETLVHTGQHYDEQMSDVFFEQLGMEAPAVNLGIGGGGHGEMTGRMLIGLEQLLLDARPDWALIYGDTNSTLAGALAAAKLHVPIAHVEAGLRSFNRKMPEEVNRVLADHLSTLLLCPGDLALRNLAREGITEGVHVIGDVMQEALLGAAERCDEVMGEALPPDFYLATVHRAENTDDPRKLASILEALHELRHPVIFPVHPRCRERAARSGLNHLLEPTEQLQAIPPVGYLEMVRLLKHAKAVLTDSGGVQKEAFWLKTPCITLREETEWTETVDAGWNQLAGSDKTKILAAAELAAAPTEHPALYGEPNAAEKIVRLLEKTETAAGKKT